MLGRHLSSGLLGAGLWIAAQAVSPHSVAAQTLDWQRVSEALVERMALQPGERVLLIAGPGRFDPLVQELRDEIKSAGAIDLGALSVADTTPAGWKTDFTRNLQGKSRADMEPLLQDVDLAVMMPGANPSDPAYGAMQDVLRGDRGRTIHFHWVGAYDLTEKVLEITPEIDAVYQRAILETDYGALAASQRAFEVALRGRKVRVTTPAGTDLQFEIGDRPVTRQDGDASAARAEQGRNLIDREIELPAGAVRMAPVEGTVAGTIVFPPSLWQGERVEGLKMRFVGGKVVSYDVDSGREAVEAELEAAGEAGRSFREFVLGMNPLLAIPEDGDAWIPYYGYGSGVVRLSLGDNRELGGLVTGGYVRWNFFPDATVTVGNDVWVRNGKLLR